MGKTLMKTILLSFATLGLAVASAASTYKVTLFQPSLIGGQELQPGTYKVEVKDNTAVISKGKQSVEAPIRSEPGDTKFASTTVRYKNGDGKYRIEEIRFGGTTTKIVFAN
jgi:hypothetical protein